MEKLRNRVRFSVSALLVSMLFMAGISVYADVDSSYDIGEGNYDIVVSGHETYCKLVADKAAKLIVVSDSTEDTFGSLYDEELNELTTDDDSAGNRQFKLQYNLEEGKTYYVGVRYYSEDTSGTIPIGVVLITSDYTGWKQVGADKYYVSEGEFVTGFKMIDGYTYYFESGKMLRDTEIWTYDSETDSSYNYRADENGRLITGWYTSTYGDIHYYDEKGRGVNGITTIDGENYFFDNGRLYTNYILQQDGKLYYFGEDGKLEESVEIKDGWVKFRGKWRYVEDGEFVTNSWKTIGGKRYYFNYSGEMAADTVDNLYDSEDDNWYYYRFSSDGSVVTGWYEDENGDEYYYDTKGHAASGIVTVDDKDYYFEYNGKLRAQLGEYVLKAGNMDITPQGGEVYCKYVPDKDALFMIYSRSDKDTYCTLYDSNMNHLISDDDSGEGNNFRLSYKVTGGDTYYVGIRFYNSSENDVIPVTVLEIDSEGFIRLESDWYYVEDGDFVRRAFKTVGGSTYYFGSDGKMVFDRVQNIYDSETGTEYQYRFDENGHMVKGWYEAEGNWYFYDKNGHAVQGMTTIGGVQYYFDYSGCMYTNYTLTENQKLYWFGEDGKLSETADMKDGWIKFKGSWYYVENDDFVRSQLKTISNKKYYFDDNGRMVTDEVIRLYSQQNGSYGYYRFDANGQAVTGWYDDNGERFYYDSDGCSESGIKTIGGKMYYFTYEGRVLVNATINTYDEEDGQYHYYRVDGNGYIVTGWYENGYGRWYFYDKKGRAAQGMTTIGSAVYYFDYDGGMYTNYTVEENQKLYWFGEDGKLSETAELKEGWVKFKGNWYYIENETPIRDSWKTINKKKYYFNYQGIMLADTTEQIYNEEEGDSYYYRFDSNGYVVTGWYVSDEGDSYYYDENGHAATRITELDGDTYYFSYDGRMNMDRITSDDTRLLYFGKDGKLADTKTFKEGWVSFKNKWFYVENGKLVVGEFKTIDGKIYYFDYEGIMLTDTVLYTYSQEDRNYHYYRINEKGYVITGWYKANENETYYYDEKGRAVIGITEIDGTTYNFAYNGRMYYNTITFDSTTVYYFGEDGKLAESKELKEGWLYFRENWYYVKDGQHVTGKVIKIGNDYYGFGYNGVMYTDASFNVYNDGSYTYYRAKSNGVLYTNSWYEVGGSQYYYGEDAAAYTGVNKIGDTTYVFDVTGRVRTNAVIEVNSKVYRIDATGAYTEIKSGWVTEPATGRWMYVENSHIVASGVKTIAGNQYIFSNRYMADNTVQYDTNTSAYYIATKGGKLYTKKGWYVFNGAWYYVNEDGSLYQGLLELNGVKYYLNPSMALFREIVIDDDNHAYTVASSGALKDNVADGLYHRSHNSNAVVYVENGKVIVDAWKRLNGAWYYFGYNGVRYEDGIHVIDEELYYFDLDGKMLANTWIRLYSSMYYANASGKLVTGTQTIEDSTYVFNTGGSLMSGIVFNNEKYSLYKDGVLVADITKEGWNKAGGDYYYLQNGKLLKSKVLNENGKIYVFDSNGSMIKNQITYISGGYYWLGSDGKARTGWIQDGKAWYYAESSTAQLAVAVSKTIGGKEYYFDYDGIMVTSDILLNDKIYHYGSDGTLSSTSAVADGWSYSDGFAYYYKSGKAYTGWVGSYYCDNGVMLRRTEVFDNNAYYYVDDYGKYVKNQWIGSMYAKANGKLAYNEWLDINGSKYYFSGTGRVTGVTYIDGETYLFDSKGVFVEKVDSGMSKGWKTKNGSYYYSVGGRYAVSEGLYIDGKWYYFGYDGRMVSDKVILGYYYGTDGARQALKGWKKIGGEWYYFNSDGNAATDWNKIGGSWYYFSGYEMVTGYHTINGRLYYFDNSGKLDREYTKDNGWFYAGGKYYYFENGKLITNVSRMIDGNMYAFISDGAIYTNSVAYTATGLRYFDASGKEVTTEGWYTTDNGKIYVGKGGVVYTGVRKISGKIYYFKDSGILVV